MTRHVVFGTGQIGSLVVEQLVSAGHDVVAVNRSGSGDFPGAEILAGDATDPTFTTRVAAAADVVYFCLNAANYDRWVEEFPPLQRAVLAGAEAAGARFVVLDNLYAYGPTGGRDLVETIQARPTSTKSATRAAMTAELLRAHHTGRVEVAIGRASDYFGPGATHSALGETVFGPALTGRTAQVMGDPDQLHSYSYTPDVAAALITLGTQPGATGSVWHLPVAQARSTRQIIDHLYRLAGKRPRSFAAGRVTLTLFGLVKPVMREYLHTLYQFTDRWVVDDSKFRTAFENTAFENTALGNTALGNTAYDGTAAGHHATPLDDALATTLQWYREAARLDASPAPITLTRRMQS